MISFRLYLLGLLSLLVNACKGQPAMPELPAADSRQTLLWEVSGKGLKSPSYFLGTMHILCPEDGGLSPELVTILDHVKSIYLEVDMDDMTQMLGMLKAMNMRNDTTLADLLTPEELERVKKYFAGKLPLPFAMMQRYKPMLLSGMMAEQMMPCKAGKGMEMILMQEASRRKLPIEGLETMAYQAGLFDSIPYAAQARQLLQAVDSAGKTGESDQQVREMIASYQAQDLDRIEALTLSEEGGMQEYLDLLLYRRNHNWAEKFEEIAPKGPLLIAVGAGHLPGDQGVLRLLEKRGYTLRPIRNKMRRDI